MSQELLEKKILQLHQKIWDQKQPTKMDVVNILILMGELNSRIDELENDLCDSLKDQMSGQH